MEERIKGMKAIESLPIMEFEKEPAGKLANRITNDVNGILTVDYSKLSIIALKAIDVLNDEMKKMKKDIDIIKEKLDL